ncbi:MAG: rhodanese-like domain-containing protein [Cyclobacteriaceae bacterium]
MKKLAVLFFLMLSLTGIGFSQSVRLLNADEFEKNLASRKDAILLDVRTAPEYNRGHIANAQLIDFYQSDFVDRLKRLDRSKPVFVYCEVGGRSGVAARALVNLGFTNVVDLKQGYRAWVSAKKPVTK